MAAVSRRAGTVIAGQLMAASSRVTAVAARNTCAVDDPAACIAAMTREPINWPAGKARLYALSCLATWAWLRSAPTMNAGPMVPCTE